MTKQVVFFDGGGGGGVGNGQQAGDPVGADSLRVGFDKLNTNFTDLYTNKEPLITAGNNTQYYRGDKTFQTLNKIVVGLANVDNTSDVNKPISSASTTALSPKEPAITAGTTSQYWRGDKSWQTLDKTAISLGNIDNTSDVNKPVSTAATTALTSKEASILASITSKYWRGDKSWQIFDKTTISLANVDNTSDVNKPVSTLSATALSAKQPLDANLSGLSSLNGSLGLLEETGSNTFTKRSIGSSSDTDILTRAAGDARFAAVVHTHVIADVTSLQSSLDSKFTNGVVLNPQSGSSYTITLSDLGSCVRMSNASANTLNVPTNATVAFAVGTEVTITQVGAGQTTIVPASGVTINTPETLMLRKTFSSLMLIKVATDTWDLIGDVQAYSPVISYAPALKFNDARNSMYL